MEGTPSPGFTYSKLYIPLACALCIGRGIWYSSRLLPELLENRCLTMKRFLLFCLLTCVAPLASSADEADLERGKELYFLCGTCHGPAGEGNALLNTPAAGKQDTWYVERQLVNYRANLRGYLAPLEDIYGNQMKGFAIAQVPDEQAIIDMAAYMHSLEAPTLPITVEGDPEEGRKIYEETCIACHGPNGEGSTLLGSPRISNQFDWYLLRQLDDFLSGARGHKPDDIYGTQMRYMAQVLDTEQKRKDVISYIASFKYTEQPD
ncbi:MAG: cytochrome c [Gammaproteobacteria bacterium]|nr:cytochrome c [Gammaproteobacteria bacterium]